MSLKLNGWVKDGLTVVSGKLSDSNTQADQLIFNLWYCVYSCLAVRQQLLIICNYLGILVVQPLKCRV